MRWSRIAASSADVRAARAALDRLHQTGVIGDATRRRMQRLFDLRDSALGDH